MNHSISWLAATVSTSAMFALLAAPVFAATDTEAEISELKAKVEQLVAERDEQSDEIKQLAKEVRALRQQQTQSTTKVSKVEAIQKEQESVCRSASLRHSAGESHVAAAIPVTNGHRLERVLSRC